MASTAGRAGRQAATAADAANPQAAAVSEKIKKLQDQADVFTRKLEIEKRRGEEMDKQISALGSRLLEQRRRMGGVNAAKENIDQVTKQVKVLESRLDATRSKYNQTISENRKLREKIDNLRQERMVFQNIYQKLEDELADKRRELTNLMEVSSVAYRARDAALKEIEELKLSAEREQQSYENEWRELGKLIEAERKKNEVAANKREQEGGKVGELTMEEEKQLKSKINKSTWNIAKDRANQMASLEKVNSYKQAFEKIKQATGVEDIDELVDNFLNSEDENFTLFSYVNELNMEIENLDDRIREVKAETARFRSQSVSTESQRKKILEGLEQKLAQTKAQTAEYEAKYADAQKSMNALRTGIQSLYTNLGCSAGSLGDMLDPTEGVTEQNMMTYLGLIEMRTNTILQQYLASQPNAAGVGAPSAAEALQGPLALPGQGPAAPLGSGHVIVEPPSTNPTKNADSDDEEGVSDGEESDQMPLSRDKLRERALKSLAKRDEEMHRRRESRGGAKAI